MYFPQFRRLEVYDQGAGTAGPWWEPSSRLHTAYFLLYPHLGERMERESKHFVDSYKGTNRIHESFTLLLLCILITSKALSPTTIKLQDRVLTYGFGETQTFSP